LHARGDRATLKATYRDMDEFWADLTAAYREEIRARGQGGAPALPARAPRAERSTLKATYRDMDEFWSDLTAAYGKEIRALCQAGATYLQIDDTTVSMMCDPRVREQVRKLGDDPERLPGIYAD